VLDVVGRPVPVDRGDVALVEQLTGRRDDEAL
jgi:hypothetical protein